MLIILNWQLTIITLVCDAAIVLYARYSGIRSKRFFAAQQASLGDLDGYVRGDGLGPKGHQSLQPRAVNVAGFDARNQELRRTGGAAQAYANSMVPMTVVIGYANYAIVAVAGGMLCINGLADVGALAELPGLCAPGGHAHQPVHAAGQLLAQRAGRCRAPVRRDGP